MTYYDIDDKYIATLAVPLPYGNSDWDTLEWIHYLDYIRHWSIWFDIKIIFWTFFKGFVNKNAY